MRNRKITDRNSILFDEYDFLQSCKSKKSYTTPYHAQFAIDECKNKNPSIHLSWYKCPYCGNYHLTSSI